MQVHQLAAQHDFHDASFILHVVDWITVRVFVSFYDILWDRVFGLMKGFVILQRCILLSLLIYAKYACDCYVMFCYNVQMLDRSSRKESSIFNEHDAAQGKQAHLNLAFKGLVEVPSEVVFQCRHITSVDLSHNCLR